MSQKYTPRHYISQIPEWNSYSATKSESYDCGVLKQYLRVQNDRLLLQDCVIDFIVSDYMTQTIIMEMIPFAQVLYIPAIVVFTDMQQALNCSPLPNGTLQQYCNVQPFVGYEE